MARSRQVASLIIPAIALAALWAALYWGSLNSRDDRPPPWNEDETAILKRLWIGSLPTVEDPSNRYLHHPVAAELGHRLFFDKRFSANGQVACASCHQPDKYFTDSRKLSRGIGTAKRNAPTIVGASHSPWLFHDGRADSLWSQALGPLEDPNEHGSNRTRYAHVIFKDSALRALYEDVFGALPNLRDLSRFPRQAGPVEDRRARQVWEQMAEADRTEITRVFVNMGKALAAYQVKLQPGPSRFDRYVEKLLAEGARKAADGLSAQELTGLKLFITRANCIICHNGPMFSDFGFHHVAAPEPSSKVYDWGRYRGVPAVLESEFNCKGPYNDAPDLGCPELDYIERDHHHTTAAFRTPGLRNVSRTAPYMHAGQYRTLEEIVEHYNDPPQHKVGRSNLLPIELDKADQAALVAFLRALDSDIAAEPEWLSAPR